jgi:hypothetical protein
MHERNPWVKKRDVKKASGSVGKTDGAEREFEAANVIEPETSRKALRNALIIT